MALKRTLLLFVVIGTIVSQIQCFSRNSRREVHLKILQIFFDSVVRGKPATLLKFYENFILQNFQ